MQKNKTFLNETSDEILGLFCSRVSKVVNYLRENEIGATVFIDNEEHREPAIRYFTNHPSDAVFIIFNDGDYFFLPWDENLAKEKSVCDKITPLTKYKNSNLEAIKAILSSKTKISPKKVELPSNTSYLDFLKFLDALPDWDIRCSENGVHKAVTEMRMIKDEYEIACTKKACQVGDLIFEGIQKEIQNQNIKTEIDVALYIEKTLRENDCEKTGFDTLAAGPSRSWAIHCFPNYTNNPWPAEGLSLLDFGVIYNGYTSDQTITIAKGPLSAEQEQLLDLVQKASDECLKLYKPGLSIKEAAEKANKIFAAQKKKMPHTLGHGIGLEIHEYPRVSANLKEDLIFKPGMILTLEPGLYDKKLGGVRLENDILITEDANEVLTHSKILRID